MLLAELDALTALLKLGRKFEYVINLSATAFPIKTRAGIQHGLSNWHTTNHLELFKQDDKALHARGSRHWFVECAEVGRVFRMPGIKPMLSGVGFFGGSQWFVLRREFVAEVMKCLQSKIPGDEDRCTYIRDILESHRFSLISDVIEYDWCGSADPALAAGDFLANCFHGKPLLPPSQTDKSALGGLGPNKEEEETRWWVLARRRS